MNLKFLLVERIQWRNKWNFSIPWPERKVKVEEKRRRWKLEFFTSWSRMMFGWTSDFMMKISRSSLLRWFSSRDFLSMIFTATWKSERRNLFRRRQTKKICSNLFVGRTIFRQFHNGKISDADRFLQQIISDFHEKFFSVEKQIKRKYFLFSSTNVRQQKKRKRRFSRRFDFFHKCCKWFCFSGESKFDDLLLLFRFDHRPSRLLFLFSSRSSLSDLGSFFFLQQRRKRQFLLSSFCRFVRLLRMKRRGKISDNDKSTTFSVAVDAEKNREARAFIN